MILWACGDSAIVAPSCGTPYWSWHHGFVSKLAIGTIPSWHHLVPFHRAADLRCQLLFCGHFALGSDTLWHQFLNWLSCLSSKFNKIRKNMTEWIITTPWVLTFEISAGQMIDWNQFEWRMKIKRSFLINVNLARLLSFTDLPTFSSWPISRCSLTRSKRWISLTVPPCGGALDQPRPV